MDGASMTGPHVSGAAPRAREAERPGGPDPTTAARAHDWRFKSPTLGRRMVYRCRTCGAVVEVAEFEPLPSNRCARPRAAHAGALPLVDAPRERESA